MPRKPYISSGISFEPLEETLDVKPLGSSLSIAIPKENAFQENRIALSPDAVGVLVNNGHTVSVENKAGEGAHFSDRDYAEAGAIIVFDKKEIFRSELVVKSAPVIEYRRKVCISSKLGISINTLSLLGVGKTLTSLRGSI